MRRICILLCLGLSAAGGWSWPRVQAGETSWVGKDIIMKKIGSKIGHTDDNGNQVIVAKLTSISYRVLDDKAGWLKVRHGKHEGWFDKNEAVLAEEADAYFGALIRANPTNDQYFSRRGEACELLGEFDKALSDFSQAIRLRPNEPDWWGNRAIFLRDRKDYDGAIRDFTKAIQLDPSASNYHGRGWTYSMKKEYDKAVADCNEALRLDPNSYLAYNRRGIALTGRGDYERALQDFAEALRLNPGHYYVFGNRAKAWLYKNQPAKAIQEYEESLKANPTKADAYNAFAWFLATSFEPNVRDGKRAVELAKKAWELSNHQLTTSLGTLAAAYAEMGQFEEAIRWQEKALENRVYARADGDEARERLKLYQDKKAYTVARETPKTSTTPPSVTVDPVKTAPVDLIASGPLKGWKEFKAPGNSFTIAFPEKPKTQKQRISSGVGNIDNHAFSHEGLEVTYLASYFDFPLDGVLTLEKSAAAYALGRKGKITSQKNITLGSNPGREIVVQLSDNNISRVRLVEVGQRRFQIVVEGPANLVNSDQATGFLNSFKLSK